MDGEITPAELQALRADGEDPTVVDIRTRAAFERGHIPDSENLPFTALTDRIEEMEDEDHVVTVCPHGKSSVQAARLVASYEGFDGRVESLAGGLTEWDGDIERSESGSDGPDSETPDEGPAAPF